ncbi:Uncharacterised protein [Salmonella enterica subsp. arizonae]|uniref:ABC transmembrane type-1 domain-containing protein n=1 Tax=Salmonella enterica subsp. arizonae TaxID=59203 RepID=A0A379T904_SALER|nr:Uncharacterised protein [Salmonella enterica subsp. arizonae]
MLLSLPLAWLLVRHPTRSLLWLYNILDIPYALPGVVLAISFILLFAHPLPLLDISLNGTLTIIFFAYMARFFYGMYKASIQLYVTARCCNGRGR